MERGGTVSVAENLSDSLRESACAGDNPERNVVDDKLITTPQLTIIEADDSVNHRAICSRCRTISSSFLSNSLRPWHPSIYNNECNWYSESCRFDESVQQFYSAPEDDVPLLGVSFRLAIQFGIS